MYQINNSSKLTWQSAHVPLSVSCCSNVPGYEDPKCFDPDQFITEFIQYLVSVSRKSASILREQLAPVFEALKQVPNRDESTEDQLAQILVDIQEGSQNNNEVESEEEEDNDEESEDDSRGIDLMVSDDEDEEEIEPENEEDRPFLNDETEEQEDISFYRRLYVKLDNDRRQAGRQQRDELAQYEDMLFGQEQTSDNKVLIKVAEKLNAYLQELAPRRTRQY